MGLGYTRNILEGITKLQILYIAFFESVATILGNWVCKSDTVGCDFNHCNKGKLKGHSKSADLNQKQ